MKITEIEVGEIFVPLAKPFKTALRTVENVEDIVVRITTDTGAAGYGEAPPTAVITGDTKGSIRCAIEDFIRPALLGMEIEDLDGIMYRLHSSIVKNTSAKAAVVWQCMICMPSASARRCTSFWEALGTRWKRISPSA